jgi:hypothetical protein
LRRAATSLVDASPEIVLKTPEVATGQTAESLEFAALGINPRSILFAGLQSLHERGGRPFACSGAMYAAVPRIMPMPVSIAGLVMVGDCDS